MKNEKVSINEAANVLRQQAEEYKTILLHAGDGDYSFIEIKPDFLSQLADDFQRLQVRAVLGAPLSPLEQLGYYALVNHLDYLGYKLG